MISFNTVHYLFKGMDGPTYCGWGNRRKCGDRRSCSCHVNRQCIIRLQPAVGRANREAYVIQCYVTGITISTDTFKQNLHERNIDHSCCKKSRLVLCSASCKSQGVHQADLSIIIFMSSTPFNLDVKIGLLSLYSIIREVQFYNGSSKGKIVASGRSGIFPN